MNSKAIAECYAVYIAQLRARCFQASSSSEALKRLEEELEFELSFVERK